MSLIKLFFNITSLLMTARGIIEILLFEILIVKIFIQVFLIINPRSNHVWVLFMEMNWGWLSSCEHWLVVTNVISLESFIGIDQHFTPKVGVLSTIVHGCVWFKGIFNVKLVFFNHDIDFLLIIWLYNLIEISSSFVLFFIKSI